MEYKEPPPLFLKTRQTFWLVNFVIPYSYLKDCGETQRCFEKQKCLQRSKKLKAASFCIITVTPHLIYSFFPPVYEPEMSRKSCILFLMVGLIFCPVWDTLSKYSIKKNKTKALTILGGTSMADNFPPSLQVSFEEIDLFIMEDRTGKQNLHF